MKRMNVKNIMEKGGLMIEALAMLGLIAVVTPTMYKKSAERTMEIEDINTATTIRTISNAADSYVSANYSTIIADMTTNSQTSRPIEIDNLAPYLPYGFDIEKSLVNYGLPKIGVSRPNATSNSLTTFVLFPAKSNEEEGIGQERTTRIASLIGANGGYTRDVPKKDEHGAPIDGEVEVGAKGIGGIWSLDNNNMKALFGETDATGATTYTDPEVNSIVTASSETIDISAANEANNDKYLQRGLSEGEEDQKWRTAMAADLYMGGIEGDGVYDKTNIKHSIRNVASLVIGQEFAGETGAASDDTQYGLYIGGSAGEGSLASAFIGGNLIAANSQFQVTGTGGSTRLGFLTGDTTNSNFQFEVKSDKLRYGYTNENYHNFEVTSDGDVTAYGHNIVLGAHKNVNETKNIKIGQMSAGWLIDGWAGDSSHSGITAGGTLGLANNTIHIRASGTEKNIGGTVYPYVGILTKQVYTDAKDLEVNSLAEDSVFWNYNKAYPQFHVEVGSNMKVDGILAAGQLAANEVEATSLSVGSDTIDAEKKWMNVNEDGVFIEDPEWGSSGSRLIVKSTGTPGSNGTDKVEAQGAIDMESMINDGGTIKYSGLALNKDGNTELYHLDSGTTGRLRSGRKIVLDEDSIDLSTPGGAMLTMDDDQIRMSAYTSGQLYDLLDVNTGGKYVDINVPTKFKAYDYDTYAYTHLKIDGNRLSAPDYIRIADRAEYSWGGSGKDIIAINTTSDYQYDTAYSLASEIFNERPNSSIYIRGGMIDIKSEDTPNQENHAFKGTGIISAGRFVANNKTFVNPINNDACEYYVDENGIRKCSPKYYDVNDRYNGSAYRYDTYMVNPAYTSVMHDIKLTTRAGARLSDVLPDFINKGIYVVRNSVDDSYKESSTNPTNPNDFGYSEINGPSANMWASPYAGEIPAPQCPPGYGRVATLTPVSFEVAQSGNVGFFDGRKFIKRTSPVDVDNNKLEPFEFVTGKHEDTNVSNPDVTFKNNSNETISYVIGTNSTNVKPFSVQQSNWLKTHVRPTANNDGFTESWSALMGFIYQDAEYGDLIKYLKTEEENENKKFKNNLHYYGINKNGSIIYWNIFPVRRNSIDAYATVYCYFDRSNAMATEINTSKGLVDTRITGELYRGYKKESSERYIERLNDPTMKYNEAW